MRESERKDILEGVRVRWGECKDQSEPESGVEDESRARVFRRVSHTMCTSGKGKLSAYFKLRKPYHNPVISMFSNNFDTW